MSMSGIGIAGPVSLDDMAKRKLILQQLHDSAQIGDITSIKCLFETHADLPIDNTRRGNTTLHTALCHNQEGLLIDYLIQNGADVNRMNNKGFCPLTLAIIHCRGSTIAVQKLIDAGAIWEKFHSGPFMNLSAVDVAIQYKNENVVSYLRGLGMDKNQQVVTPTTNTEVTSETRITKTGHAICPICNTLVKFPTKMSRIVSDQIAVEMKTKVNGEYGGGEGKHKHRKYIARKYMDQLLAHSNGEA